MIPIFLLNLFYHQIYLLCFCQDHNELPKELVHYACHQDEISPRATVDVSFPVVSEFLVYLRNSKPYTQEELRTYYQLHSLHSG